MVEVFRGVWRVLRKDGTVWLNLGDSYAGSGKGQMGDGRHSPEHGSKQGTSAGTLTGGLPTAYQGLKPKDQCGIPWRVALALQADGWYLRSDIIWAKPNPMPESVTDRPTKSHEYLFLLTKAARYYYDQEAVREPHTGPPPEYYGVVRKKTADYQRDLPADVRRGVFDGKAKHYHPAGRNLRSVWTIATQPYPEAHFATFPEKLVEPCIKAGTSERGVCATCGAPWVRMMEKGELTPEEGVRLGGAAGVDVENRTVRDKGWLSEKGVRPNAFYPRTTTGWAPTCRCNAPTTQATVLDPFVGSGTTNLVAQKLGRRSIGIDLSEKYLALAQRRLEAVPLPLGMEAEA